MKISRIRARQILDSRGNPTVECEVEVQNNIVGRSSVPSGVSTGKYESVELRDNDRKQFGGKSVYKAIENVHNIISKKLIGRDVTDQEGIDRAMIELDGTENKGRLGANAILAVSLACAQAAAKFVEKPLFEYVYILHHSGQVRMTEKLTMPIPMMNLINGGRHAQGVTDIQEYMIVPIGAKTFSHAIQMGAEIFYALGLVLKKKGYTTLVGDEGGFAPQLENGNKEPLELLISAVEMAGYKHSKDVVFGLDVAASEFYKDGLYHLKKENSSLSTDKMIDWLNTLAQSYPIASIEDGLSQDDWEGWKVLTEKLGDKIQIVGDDLFATNTSRIEQGIAQKAANAVLIKPNQVGTLTETIQSVQKAQKAGLRTIISHRSGETEDTTIAHLAVGLSAGQIKAGSVSRSERLAKYNELIRIEEMLGDKARLASFFSNN